MALEDVTRVSTHMCQFGMTSRIGGKGSDLGSVMKPTDFMTNSPRVASQLARMCPGDLVGGRAAGAAIYPPELCRARRQGLAAQVHEDKIARTGSCRSAWRADRPPVATLPLAFCSEGSLA